MHDQACMPTAQCACDMIVHGNLHSKHAVGRSCMVVGVGDGTLPVRCQDCVHLFLCTSAEWQGSTAHAARLHLIEGAALQSTEAAAAAMPDVEPC